MNKIKQIQEIISQKELELKQAQQELETVMNTTIPIKDKIRTIESELTKQRTHLKAQNVVVGTCLYMPKQNKIMKVVKYDKKIFGNITFGVKDKGVRIKEYQYDLRSGSMTRSFYSISALNPAIQTAVIVPSVVYDYIEEQYNQYIKAIHSGASEFEKLMKLPSTRI